MRSDSTRMSPNRTEGRFSCARSAVMSSCPEMMARSVRYLPIFSWRSFACVLRAFDRESALTSWLSTNTSPSCGPICRSLICPAGMKQCQACSDSPSTVKRKRPRPSFTKPRVLPCSLVPSTYSTFEGLAPLGRLRHAHGLEGFAVRQVRHGLCQSDGADLGEGNPLQALQAVGGHADRGCPRLQIEQVGTHDAPVQQLQGAFRVAVGALRIGRLVEGQLRPIHLQGGGSWFFHGQKCPVGRMREWNS